MNLLDLPNEVFWEILRCAVSCRELNRALRLKLVCRLFYNSVPRAIFEVGLDDNVRARDYTNMMFMKVNWRTYKSYGYNDFWHAYLVYRVRTETDPTQGQYVNIRQVVDAWCGYTNDAFEATVDALCWLVLEQGEMTPGHRSPWQEGDEPLNLGLSLLSVAAHFGHIPLAKKFLAEVRYPDSLFPSPTFLAAVTGNFDMLELLQEALLNSGVRDPWDGHWEAIRAACQYGDVDIFRLAIKYEMEEFRLYPRSYGLRTLTKTVSLELYRYICSLVGEPTDGEKGTIVTAHTKFGNTEMVRYLLDGDVLEIRPGKLNELLEIAVKFNHDELVDLLLKRGADTDYWRHRALSTELCLAVSRGSLPIVRKLLDYGAKIMYCCLECAVMLEHTGILTLLLTRGSVKNYNKVFKAARKNELWSMVDFMIEYNRSQPKIKVPKRRKDRKVFVANL
ncbi:ankyrin repeat-containing domain protein [Hypoxylon trugodes]|uniref:ankyrin repeat-containing domain protein n=1 Tax=Hypoxylon trugodes TaxID=326681 RepID=UPI00219BEDCB|nr:ankyrin repeat-containing domain protein [Hypoxylon trugodes]KAI1392668.1 ankyrin repeat-containing domain protein [Hypoxylon trugodes]